MRKIARSVVKRVHVGTVGILGQPVAPTPAAADAVQWVRLSRGHPVFELGAYAGEEVNTIRDCFAWGAYKGLVLDDLKLSPGSGAHATVVDNLDVQSVHAGVVQESQNGAGCSFTRLSDSEPGAQQGSAEPTTCLLVGGYSNRIHSKYIEAGAAIDVIIKLDTASVANEVDFEHCSFIAPGAGAFIDLGLRNNLRYRDDVVTGNGTSGAWRPVVTYSRGNRQVSYVGFWNGASMTVVGATLTRNGVCDYSVFFIAPLLSPSS